MKVTIAGAHGIGAHLAKLLSRNNNDITLIDEDVSRLDRINSILDIMTIQAAPNNINLMRTAGVPESDLFIGVTPDENLNLTSCILAKALGAKKTVAMTSNDQFTNPEIREFFNQLGVNETINPVMLAADDIVKSLKMSWVRERWDVHGGTLVMLGIKIRESCAYLNMPLKTFCGPNDPYLVVAIKRRNETIIPNGDNMLKNHDLAFFMTKKEYIAKMRKLAGKENYEDVRNVIFMGGGETSVRAVRKLPEYMHAKIFEKDLARCEELNHILQNDKTLIINGDGRDTDLLNQEGIENTQAFVAMTGNAETNIIACLTAKQAGVRKTVSGIENIEYARMAENLDIGTVINKRMIAASNIYQMLLNADVMNVRFMMSVNSYVAEFIVKEKAKVTKKLVKDLDFPRGMTLGGLVREGEGILVSGNTQIIPGDTVIVFCHSIDLKSIAKYFN